MTPGEPLIRWDWVVSHAGDIVGRLGEHVLLASLAVVVGFILSFALTLLIRRYPDLYSPVTWVTGVLYTIPSLALFALLIPITKLSLLTAEIGLVSYTLLILIRNMVAGLRGVPAVDDLVRMVDLETIGLTTVTALIGQGGFGFFILLGIQSFFTTPLLVGAVGSVLLAIVTDTALVAVQRLLVPWERRR